jgi:hypothetical protein
MKIDVVYTWVDGSDEKWKKKKNEKAKQLGKAVENESTNDALFKDNQELRYSLRSIEQFAPWVNNIFIITDNQVPNWLNLDNPKIRVVDHKEIFKNHNFLPTFSSQAIESQMHHIEELSEYFIYFNDDMFIGNYCTPEYFFTKNGKPKIFVSEIFPIPNKKLFDITKRAPHKRNTYQYTLANTRNVLKNKIGKTIYHSIRHSIKPLLKSVLFELEELFNEEIDNTIKNNFRTKDDILSIYLFEFYAIAKKIGKTEYLFSADTERTKLDLLAYLYKKNTFGFINLHEKNIKIHLDRIKNSKPFTFCLNQTKETSLEHLEITALFLKDYFPNASSFEK